MVKIIETKQSISNDGKPYVSLKIQGEIEAVQSQQTGRLYLTARTCYLATTFDEATAESLIGKELPGTVKKVESEPYQYTVKETGEVIVLTYSYEYSPEEIPVELPAVRNHLVHAEA